MLSAVEYMYIFYTMFSLCESETQTTICNNSTQLHKQKTLSIFLQNQCQFAETQSTVSHLKRVKILHIILDHTTSGFTQHRTIPNTQYQSRLIAHL